MHVRNEFLHKQKQSARRKQRTETETEKHNTKQEAPAKWKINANISTVRKAGERLTQTVCTIG